MVIGPNTNNKSLQGLFVPFENVWWLSCTHVPQTAYKKPFALWACALTRQACYVHFIILAIARKEFVMNSSKKQGPTGPRSIAGKRISSMNALRNGVFAKTPVLPFEDDRTYERHVKDMFNSLDYR